MRQSGELQEQEETALAVRAWEPSDHRPCSVQMLRFSVSPYPSTCWMVQRLTSRRLASSRWLTPFDRSALMYSRCCSLRSGRLPGKRPSVRALAWPATERSLIEFRHHSLKARTIASWSLPLAVAVSKSFRQGPELHSCPVQALDHLQPVGQPPWRAGRCGSTRVSPSTTRSSSARRPPRPFLVPLASSARMLPMEHPTRNQALHPQVQILVFRLPDRDPSVAVEGHPTSPLAGIPEVLHSAKGVATGFSQPPTQLRGVGISSHDGPIGLDLDRRSRGRAG